MSLSRLDEKRLELVDPRLVQVVKTAFSDWTLDSRNSGTKLVVVEGFRTKERQQELFGQGRTALECAAAGVPVKYSRATLSRVTWTMKSKHLDGKAVDCAPTRGGMVVWNDHALFDRMAEVFLAAAAKHGLTIRNGADWDRDGIRRERGETDSPHFEIVGD